MSIDPTTVRMGDEYWVANFETCGMVKVPCPVCNGDQTVTVILGDGTELHPDCEYCGNGFDGPRGFVEQTQRKAHPVRLRVTEISASEGGEYEFRSRVSECSARILSPDHMFTDEGEALAESERRLSKWVDDVDRHNAEVSQKRAIKHYGWTVGYWMREAKRLREEAERMDERAGVNHAS